MKVRTILLSMVLVAGVSLNVSAQFKIGGKSINTKKLVNAASDAAKAVTSVSYTNLTMPTIQIV